MLLDVCVISAIIVLVLSMMAGRIAEYILDAPRRVRKWADDAERLEIK